MHSQPSKPVKWYKCKSDHGKFSNELLSIENNSKDLWQPTRPLMIWPTIFSPAHRCLSSHHPQCSMPLISSYLFQTPCCLCTCCSLFLEWLYLPRLYNSFSLFSLHYPQVTSWDRTSLLTPSYLAPPLYSFSVLFFPITVITTNRFFFFVYNMKAETYLFISLFPGTWEEL